MKLILNMDYGKTIYSEHLIFYLERVIYMKEIIVNWVKKYKLHLVLWLLFILYETVVIGLITGVFGNPAAYISHYILIMVLFYVHAYFSLPWALKNNINAIWKLPLIVAIEISAFIFISYLTDEFLIFSTLLKLKHYKLTYQNSLQSLYRGIYFMGFSTGYYFILRYGKERRKTNELEKQRLNDIIYRQKSEQELTKAQNAFLKAQINPHFLFNTLDFVYHSIVELSPPAANAIITLAEMMRYAIDSDKMGDYIPLSDEIDQIENLLYLNQIRKKNKLLFQLQYEEEVRRLYLIPLVLLTMVENIFKHGNLTEKDHDALVSIYIKGGIFIIETDNLINNQVRPGGNHKGLSNTEQRLKYAYGENILFTNKATERNHFIVRLEIPVDLLLPPVLPSKASPDTGK